MKRNNYLKGRKTLKNNNRRRLNIKRAHQRVLQRQRLFNNDEMQSQAAQA